MKINCLLPPANEVCEGYVFTGVCHSVHRVGHVWLPGGACVVAPRGHAWLLPGGMRGCSGGACMVALGGMPGCSGGCVWFYLGGHAWFYLRGHVWFFQFFRIQ